MSRFSLIYWHLVFPSNPHLLLTMSVFDSFSTESETVSKGEQIRFLWVNSLIISMWAYVAVCSDYSSHVFHSCVPRLYPKQSHSFQLEPCKRTGDMVRSSTTHSETRSVNPHVHAKNNPANAAQLYLKPHHDVVQQHPGQYVDLLLVTWKWSVLHQLLFV